MYAPEGYEPLASLWTWFEARFGTWCQSKAVEFYSNPDGYTPAEIFGSPRDLCEDLFLRSLEDFDITLAATIDPPVSVRPVLSNSPARLFEKATPFESFMISTFPDEAGIENEWLIRMGSRQFEPTGHTDTQVKEWLQVRYCNANSSVSTSIAALPTFHTLPYLFQRGSFVFPSELPPWSSDLLEDAYFRDLKDRVGGRAFCLSIKQSAKWRRSNSNSKVEQLLERQVPAFKQISPTRKAAKAGRPAKQDRIIAVLRETQWVQSGLSRKEILRRLEDRLGESTSISTLDRALTALKDKKDDF